MKVENIIEAENISYTYPDGTPGLNDFTGTIKKNTITLIEGDNGSGKSTLLNIFAGLLFPRGKIKIFGMEPKKNIKEIRKRTSILFQDPDDFLFNTTVINELLYTPLHYGMPRKEAEKLAMETAKEFRLEDILEKPPFRLSGGEKKRVALACVFEMKPELVLLDEPTANIDAKTRSEILEKIRNYSGTIVISTHDVSSVKDMVNNVFVLEDKKLVKAISEIETIEH